MSYCFSNCIAPSGQPAGLVAVSNQNAISARLNPTVNTAFVVSVSGASGALRVSAQSTNTANALTTWTVIEQPVCIAPIDALFGSSYEVVLAVAGMANTYLGAQGATGINGPTPILTSSPFPWYLSFFTGSNAQICTLCPANMSTYYLAVGDNQGGMNSLTSTSSTAQSNAFPLQLLPYATKGDVTPSTASGSACWYLNSPYGASTATTYTSFSPFADQPWTCTTSAGSSVPCSPAPAFWYTNSDIIFASPAPNLCSSSTTCPNAVTACAQGFAAAMNAIQTSGDFNAVYASAKQAFGGNTGVWNAWATGVLNAAQRSIKVTFNQDETSMSGVRITGVEMQDPEVTLSGSTVVLRGYCFQVTLCPSSGSACTTLTYKLVFPSVEWTATPSGCTLSPGYYVLPLCASVTDTQDVTGGQIYTPIYCTTTSANPFHLVLNLDESISGQYDCVQNAANC